MLPGVEKVPPSTISRLSSPLSSGSCRKAMAALVSGPVVTSVISPGAARDRLEDEIDGVPGDVGAVGARRLAD